MNDVGPQTPAAPWPILVGSSTRTRSSAEPAWPCWRSAEAYGLACWGNWSIRACAAALGGVGAVSQPPPLFVLMS